MGVPLEEVHINIHWYQPQSKSIRLFTHLACLSNNGFTFEASREMGSGFQRPNFRSPAVNVEWDGMWLGEVCTLFEESSAVGTSGSLSLSS